MPTTTYNAPKRYNEPLTYNGQTAASGGATGAGASVGRYEVRAVQRNGTQIASLNSQGGDSGCNLHRYTWQLNHPGSAEFSVGIYDSKAVKFQKFTEVQIWTDDALEWWGVIVNVRLDQSAANPRVVFQCQGLLWYLLRRYVGKADRTNKALNPGFESGTANYAATGTTFTVDTAERITGTQSAKLVQTTLAADAYIEQSVSVTSGSVGDLITVAARFKIIDTGWTGPAFENRGLYIERVGATAKGGRGVKYDFAEIDSDTPRGAWQRVEATVHMPKNVTETIRWRFYSPAVSGGIRWDESSVTLMESLSYYNTDQAIIFSKVVEHLQDTAFGKDNMSIATNTPLTGLLLDWHSQFAEHQQFGSIVEEFTTKANGFDIGFAYNSAGTTRTLVTYYPRKGTHRPLYALTHNNIANYNYSEDGERAVTSMTILGEGSGPDREEGGAIDVPAGWPVLEEVETAPQGADIDSLDQIATEKLRVRRDPRNLHVTVSMHQKDLRPLKEGDTIPINIDDGWVQIGGNWRVISKTVAPHQDNITLELNPA